MSDDATKILAMLERLCTGQESFLAGHRELTAQVRALAELIASRQSTSLSPARRIHLSEVLALIHAAIGPETFTTNQLFKHAQVVRKGEPLRDAIVAAVKGLNRKAFGKLLLSAVGKDFGGFTVERVDNEGSVVTWRVCGFETYKPTRSVASPHQGADDAGVQLLKGKSSWNG